MTSADDAWDRVLAAEREVSEARRAFVVSEGRTAVLRRVLQQPRGSLEHWTALRMLEFLDGPREQLFDEVFDVAVTATSEVGLARQVLARVPADVFDDRAAARLPGVLAEATYWEVARLAELFGEVGSRHLATVRAFAEASDDADIRDTLTYAFKETPAADRP